MNVFLFSSNTQLASHRFVPCLFKISCFEPDDSFLLFLRVDASYLLLRLVRCGGRGRRRTTPATVAVIFHISSLDVGHLVLLDFSFNPIHTSNVNMTALRAFPFIGAAVAIAAVVLSIIGVSTTYWFSTDLNTHAGLWRDCIGGLCRATTGGRSAALAIAVSQTNDIGARVERRSVS